MNFHPTPGEAIEQRDEAEENHQALKRTTDAWADKLVALRFDWDVFCDGWDIGEKGRAVERALKELEK